MGLCAGLANLSTQQFAILSYRPSTVKKNFLGYPQRRFPAFSEKFVQNPIVSWQIIPRTFNNNSHGQVLNHPEIPCGAASNQSICVADLKSYVSRPDITDVEPDYQFILGFDVQRPSVASVFAPDNYGHFLSEIDRS